MHQPKSKILKQVHPSRIIIPVLIGIGVGIYLISTENVIDSFQSITYSFNLFYWLFLALGLLLIREIGYILRIRILSDNKLSWISATRIILLWEFASSVTPSAIGGTGVAFFFLYKEGLNLGKSSAIVLATFFLDELYFILMAPLLLFFINFNLLFQVDGENYINKYFYFAIGGYGIKLVLLLIATYALFINPKAVKRILSTLFKLPILRQWRVKALQTGEEIEAASKELKKQNWQFWIKNFAATFVTWTSRYWIVNLLIIALYKGLKIPITDHLLNFAEHQLIFARQLVMWIIMMVMPSPGGSGFSEMVFLEYMNDFIPNGFAALMTLFWRLISYYPFLIIGVILFPIWIQKRFLSENNDK